jgi:hypothetical protein
MADYKAAAEAEAEAGERCERAEAEAHNEVMRALEGLTSTIRAEALSDIEWTRYEARDKANAKQARANRLAKAELERANVARAEKVRYTAARTCPQCQGLKQADEATCRWASCEKAEDATEAR